MAARREHRRWRLILAWALSAALLGGYALLGDDPAPGGGPDLGETGPQLPEEDRGKEMIEVVEVRPADPAPGGAVEVDFINTFQNKRRPLHAWLSVTDYAAGKQLPSTEMERLHASDERLIVRVPLEAFEGRAKLRVGYTKEDRSKPYDLRVRAVSHRKLFREVLGGLALLVFGLRVMSRGSRQYTGHRSQGILARIGRRAPAALGLGLMVGGLTQFTTTAAGLVVGLVESHLLATVPAVVVLLGAQLGAAVTPSVLGLVSTKEGLLVLTVGVLWLGLASDRRSEAFGKIILGCGLLFFGLYLLRQGFEPLVSDPEIFPYIDRFDAATLPGRLSCVAAGILLSAILQGPAPVFVLVLGLAQSSGRLDLASALAILSGSGLGAAIGTLVVAWPFGRDARRLARLHLLLGAASTVLLAVSVGLWASIADAAVPGHAAEIAYGKKILLPKMGGHLVAGFALSQLTVTALLAAVAPAAARLLARLMPETQRPLAAISGGVPALRAGLGAVLGHYHRALQAINELCLTGHRGRGRDCEHVLADARAEIEDLFGGAVRSKVTDPDMIRLRQAALATVQLQRAIENLLRHAERSTEQNMALSPAGQAWQLAPQDEATLRALHGLLIEGVSALGEQLKTGETPDLDTARAREIRLNGMEQESRMDLLGDADRGEDSGVIAKRLNSSELVNAYETVGNHLYRLYETLAAEVHQETPAQAI
jgi:Na+/phosphate symporter